MLNASNFSNFNDSLLHLLPYAKRYPDTERHHLVLNSDCYLENTSPKKTEIENLAPLLKVSGIRQCLPERQSILWVRHPGTGMLSPFAVQKGDFKKIRELLFQEDFKIARLPRELRRRLRLAEVLVDPGYESRERQKWQKICLKAAESTRRGYGILPGVINPLQIAALRKYLRHLHREGIFDWSEDTECPRYYSHNLRVLSFYHSQLKSLVNRFLPAPVIPSYNFLSIYPAGSALKRHSDRKQCAWNMSLLVDTSPEADRKSAWPLFLQIEGKPVKINLEMGDAVIYRGSHHEHWRPELAPKNRVSVCIFHFVSTNFKGPLI